MMEGLWKVEFKTSIEGSGSGVVVAEDRKVFGGDAGCYYTGRCVFSHENIETAPRLQRYRTGHISVFGNVDRPRLSGTIAGSNAVMSGQLGSIRNHY
jgi:hypothetical protein